MRATRQGQVYDTDAATLLVEVKDGTFPPDAASWYREGLYQMPDGRLFLAGEGGADTRWCRRLPDRSRIEGDGIEPLSARDAMEWAEVHASIDAIDADAMARVAQRIDLRTRLEAAYMAVEGARTGHGAIDWYATLAGADPKTVRRWIAEDSPRVTGPLDLYDEGRRVGADEAIAQLRERLTT
jgi:hypothetical protein